MKTKIILTQLFFMAYLCFGNICNKSCNICRPGRSSMIAKEYKKLGSDHEIYSIDPDPEIKQKDFSGIHRAFDERLLRDLE